MVQHRFEKVQRAKSIILKDSAALIERCSRRRESVEVYLVGWRKPAILEQAHA